jgi:hypothetical protein
MGTRANIKVYQYGKDSPVLVSIYQQDSGYFNGVGKDLQEFLDGYTIVNGISSDTPEKAANGMGCLAAQLVSHLKTEIGGTYLTRSDDVQEYNYHIYVKKGKLHLEGHTIGNYEKKKFKIKSKVDPFYD